MIGKAPPAFWIDFIIYPIVGVFCLTQITGPFLGVLVGVLLFTFIEYWAHRTVLHGFMYHGDHEHHHKFPADYILFPIWFIPSIYMIFYAVFPLTVFTGLVWGLVWFICWHHILHHINLVNWPRFIQQYALWHLRHHHEEDCNYGITVPFWDWVFRTSRKS